VGLAGSGELDGNELEAVTEVISSVSVAGYQFGHGFLPSLLEAGDNGADQATL
jgi:hypothetical protein